MAPHRSWVRDVMLVVHRLLDDDSGQDLVEYGLLAALVVAGGIALLPAIQSGMSRAYSGWDVQTYNLWIPDDPLSSP